MLIPKGVLKLERVASHDKTRYAMNGILVSRDKDNGEAIAVATDGKRLIEARWDDSTLRVEFPACGVDLEPRKDLLVVIPGDSVKAIEKAMPRKVKFDHENMIAVQETLIDQGERLKIATVEAGSSNVREVKPVEGHFPPYADVMPGANHSTMRVALNARFLLEIAEALAAAHDTREALARDKNDKRDPDVVVLEIKDGDSPIIVKGTGPCLNGVKTRALLMPVALPTDTEKKFNETARKALETTTTKPKRSRKTKASSPAPESTDHTKDANACAAPAPPVEDKPTPRVWETTADLSKLAELAPATGPADLSWE